MGYLTYGHLNITAKRIGTDITLDELHKRMQRRIYSGEVPTTGWANVAWRAESEEAPRLNRSHPGSPQIEDFGDYRVLLARYYEDRLDHAFQRKMRGLNIDGFAKEQRWEVLQIDVAIIESDSLHVFIASHEEKDVALVMKLLRDTAKPDDDDWEVGAIPKLEPESDLYLWMIHRWDKEGGTLTSSLKIVDFRTLSQRDTAGHVIRSLSGIDTTRVDTLASAAETYDLGPAKFALHDRQVKMRVDVFLLLDGTFDIHRTGTNYDDYDPPSAQLGIFATLDFATRVLPRLHNAYRKDNKWRNGVRASFVEECRQKLADRFN